MFGGRFSLTKFSLNSIVDFDARVEGMFIETIMSVVLPTQNTAVESNYRSHVTSEITLTCGIKMNNIFDEKITANVISVRDAPIIVSLREDIDIDINAAIDYNIMIIFDEQAHMRPLVGVIDFMFDLALTSEILSNIKGAIDFRFNGNYIEYILSEVLSTTAVSLEYNFNERVSSEIIPANNVNAITVFNEIVNSHIFLAYNFPFGISFREAFSSTNQLSSNTHVSHDVRESIFASTMANEIDSDTLIINVTIRPGSTLIIDSENFIVTLDGANIIHLHSGDFINISRDTINMAVTPDGQLKGELMYIERYL